jgi:predicted aspartyl protease
MFLDTGASKSVLTPRVARQLGVSVRRTKNTPYRRATRLGRDLSFYIDTRRTDTASRTGWEYGFLGGEFLDY